jgi:hypothetical protein
VPLWIRHRCRAKARKHYGGCAGLLVYLNWSDYGARQHEIEEALVDATSRARLAFSSIWVLWKARSYQTWRDGQPSSLTLDAPGTRDAEPVIFWSNA